MYLECMLVFKSYKPLKLEKGMFFLTYAMGVNIVRQITEVPKDMDEFVSINGYPVEPYIIDPGNPNEDNGYVVATPEQVGWFDEGDHSDKISDITVNNINDIFEHYDGWIDVEMTETDDEEGEYVPLLYNNKVTIRMPQEPYDDDDWDDDADDEHDEDKGLYNEIY